MPQGKLTPEMVFDKIRTLDAKEPMDSYGRMIVSSAAVYCEMVRLDIPCIYPGNTVEQIWPDPEQ